MTKFRYPTVEEVRAIELAARLARNRELGRLARLAGSAIASTYKRLASAISARRMRHA